MDDKNPASARTMGTVLGAVVGGSVGYGCSLFIDISWATRSFCIFVVPLLILFSVWICNKIPYFDKNNYAALMMLITNVSVCVMFSKAFSFSLKYCWYYLKL